MMRSDLVFLSSWALSSFYGSFSPALPRGKATSRSRNRREPQRDPKPFAGFTRTPDCPACEQEAGVSPQRQRPTHLHPACSSPAAAVATSIPPDTSARMPPVRITAGWAGGISAPMAIPTADGGDSLYAWVASGYFLETHGTPFHGKQVDPDKLVWAMQHWPKVSVSVPWPGCLRPIPTRFWAGWWRRPHTLRPSRPLLA